MSKDDSMWRENANMEAWESGYWDIWIQSAYFLLSTFYLASY